MNIYSSYLNDQICGAVWQNRFVVADKFFSQFFQSMKITATSKFSRHIKPSSQITFFISDDFFSTFIANQNINFIGPILIGICYHS